MVESSTRAVLVTGSSGFIGRNLITALNRQPGLEIRTFDVNDTSESLESSLSEAHVIYHLAGINRPETEAEFHAGNVGLTGKIISILEKFGRKPTVVLSSSIQAELDNPYGRSKKAAEDALVDFSHRTGAPICIYRLPNVFGKWSRPNYNTVVATFCHNIARGIGISISDPNRKLDLVYIDDIVAAFMRHLEGPSDPSRQSYTVPVTFRLTLGDIADRIRRFNDIRHTLVVPDLSDEFNKRLHATFLSFLPEEDFASPVKLNSDNRGWLFELIKSEHFGQIFISKTFPGITRGNHYHDTKLEKFCVIQGGGIIRFRQIHSDAILEFPVDDKAIKVVDIPPGYTHSIENTGEGEMICLFWANQIFDPKKPDTFFLPVAP
jgi:UDP-2-acetamido-2,6-beta-L-arabino-hexul-4-ose reductase